MNSSRKNKIRLAFARCLVILGNLLYVHIILNALNVLPWIAGLSSASKVTVNGVLTAFELFCFVLAMILSDGKYFKSCMFSAFWIFSTTVTNTIKYGINSTGAGLGLSLFEITLVYTLWRYIEHLKKDEAELGIFAFTDQLTGCLNRRGLLRELTIRAELEKKFYLCFLDLDSFKQINDTLGHEAGDELLIEISAIWSHIKSKVPYTVYRLGGDEFAIIYETMNKEWTTDFIADVLQSTTKLQPKFSNYVTASAGLALFGIDTSDVQQLLSYADTAMYKAKLSGKNCFYFFDQDMYHEIMKHYTIEKDLRDALKNNSFTMLYQPQYALSNHHLVGFESLIRLRGKDGKFTNTQDFIKVAEKSGLIYDIDLWVIHNVMKQTKDFVTLHPDIEISINVSGKHITNPGFVEKIIDSLTMTGFPPKNLKIEITESSYIRYIDEAIDGIQRLKVLGVKTALDDFGIGYSFLNYLARIPVDSLKIDKSFVDDILLHNNEKSFIDIVIKLGHLTGCKVIAEGVESEEQLDTLAVLGCDQIQGYIWGKPMELSKLSEAYR